MPMIPLVFALALLFPRPVAGQGAVAAILGTLVDERTGRPVLRGRLCESRPPAWTADSTNCTGTDSLGGFRLTFARSGEVAFRITCRSRRFFEYGMEPVTIRRTIGAGETTSPPIAIDASWCEQRPEVRRTGEFVGYYSYGFEESRFVWPEQPTYGIWAHVDHRRVRERGLRFPPSTTADPYPCAAVRWFGTLSGPGFHGHLGGSLYELAVDSAVSVTAAPRAACAMATVPRAPLDTTGVVAAVEYHLILSGLRRSRSAPVGHLMLDSAAGRWNQLIVRSMRRVLGESFQILSDSAAHYADRYDVTVTLTADSARIRITGEWCAPPAQGSIAGGTDYVLLMTRDHSGFRPYPGSSVNHWDGICAPFRRKVR